MPSVSAPSRPRLSGNLETGGRLPFRPFPYLRQMGALFSFFGIGLAVSPVCALLARAFRRTISPDAGQRLIRRLFHDWLTFWTRRGVFAVDFPEAANLQELRGTIIAPNHPSLLDAVILLAATPRTVCIMRANLIRSPFLGGAARLAGYVTNDRGPALVRQGIERIHSGQNLLIFPEGTRTRNQAVNSFRKGFALIATRTQAPIQTVFIERHSRYLSKNAPLFSRTSLPIRYHIRLGKVVRPEAGETAQTLAARLESYFRDQLVNNGEEILLKSAL